MIPHRPRLALLLLVLSSMLVACGGNEPPRGWQEHARGDIGKQPPPAAPTEDGDKAADGSYVVEPPPPFDLDESITSIDSESEVIPPRKVSNPTPEYTPEAREARTEGVVVIQAVIDEQGVPWPVKVVRGLPHGLSEQAVESVRQWRFEPATMGGEPVKIYYNLTVNFQLE